jgi:hypothetical protein
VQARPPAVRRWASTRPVTGCRRRIGRCRRVGAEQVPLRASELYSPKSGGRMPMSRVSRLPAEDVGSSGRNLSTSARSATAEAVGDVTAIPTDRPPALLCAVCGLPAGDAAPSSHPIMDVDRPARVPIRGTAAGLTRRNARRARPPGSRRVTTDRRLVAPRNGAPPSTVRRL